MFCFSSVGGVAKSQNCSQMNLSGSSSSLTSDAGAKAVAGAPRNYGIGGALLHKRILLMTGQRGRKGRSQTEREDEERRSGGEKESEEETQAAERGGGGRSGRQNHQAAQADVMNVGRPRDPRPPIRTRLTSPFRVLRERSQSRERAKGEEGEGAGPPPQGESQGAGRSVSPNPFLWLCRDRRRKTV